MLLLALAFLFLQIMLSKSDNEQTSIIKIEQQNYLNNFFGGKYAEYDDSSKYQPMSQDNYNKDQNDKMGYGTGFGNSTVFPKTKMRSINKNFEKQKKDQTLFKDTIGQNPSSQTTTTTTTGPIDERPEDKEMRKMFELQPVGGLPPMTPSEEEQEKQALLFKPIQIESVSNEQEKTGQPVKSSLEGGSELCIKGQGFGKDILDVQVMVGNDECELLESTDVMIKCRTKKVMLEQVGDIKVTVGGRQSQCLDTVTQCKVTFDQDSTDVIDNILPHPSDPSKLNIYGQFSQGIDNIKVGGYLCQIIQNNKQQDKPKWSLNKEQNMTTCQMDKNMPQGKYNVTVMSKKGKVQKQKSAKKYDKEDKAYEVERRARINKLSTHQATSAGGKVTIYGQGFGNNPALLDITLSQQKCKVLLLQEHKVECEFNQLVNNATLQEEGGSGAEAISYKVKANVFDFHKEIANVEAGVNEQIYQELLGDFQFKSRRSLQQHRIDLLQGYVATQEPGLYTFMAKVVNQHAVLIRIQVNNVWKNIVDTILTKEQFQTEVKGTGEQLEGNKKYLVQVWLGQTRMGDKEQRKQSGGFKEEMEQYVALGMQQPSSTWKSNSASKVQRIQIKPQKESQQLKLWNVRAGYYYLVTDKYSKKLPFNAKPKLVKQQLDSIAAYGDAQVKLLPLARDGQVKQGLKQRDTFGYVYQITYQQLRPPQRLPKVYSRFLKAFIGRVEATMVQLTTQSAFNKYQLQVDGQTTQDINMYDDHQTIKAKLLKLGFNKDIEVDIQGEEKGNQQILIKFYNQTKQNDLQVVGQQDKPWVDISTVQQKSMNTIHMPISYDRLSVFSNVTQLKMKVAGQLVACPQQVCKYQVVDNATYPQIQDFTLNNDILTINLDKDLATSKENITVKLGNTHCTPQAINQAVVTCKFSKNADQSLVLEGGNLKPYISVDKIGSLKLKPSLTKVETVTPVITSLTPSGGSRLGGQQLVIKGKYFPKDNTTSVEVKQKDVVLPILKMNNQEIVVMTGDLSSDTAATATITVQFGQATASSTFTYSTSSESVTITAIDTNTIAPHTPQVVTLTFDKALPTSATFKARLVNRNHRKQNINLKVTPSGSSITLGVQGVRVGSYDLEVHQENSGLVKSNVNTTLTAVIEITSVTPQVGSVNGNTNLTITGVNLLHQQSQVFIGSPNNRCKVVSMTATQINCITQKYTAGQHLVILEVRGVDKSTCSASSSCHFTYDQAVTPTITGALLHYQQKFDDIITFQGTNLLDTTNNSPAVLVLNNKHFIYSIQQTATSLQFKLNNTRVQQGKYYMTVYVKGKGIVSFGSTQVMPVLEYVAKMEAPSVTSGSYGGHLITVKGAGFDHSTRVQVLGPTAALPVPCQSWFKKHGLQFRCPPFQPYDNGQATIMLVSKGRSLTNYTYTNTVGSTQKLQDINTTITLTTSSIQLSLASSANLLFPNETPWIYLTGVHDQYFRLNSSSQTSSATGYTVDFSTVPLGEYKVNVLYASGYAFFNTNYVKVINPAIAVGAGFTAQSFAGGMVQINGLGLSKQVGVKICGLTCNYINSNYSQLNCSQNGLKVQPALGQLDSQWLNWRTVTADNQPTLKALDDKNVASFYLSTRQDEALLFDFGEGLLVEIQELYFHPFKFGQNFEGGVFEVSNDTVSFQPLWTVGKVDFGWNSAMLNSSTSGRYVRLKFNNQVHRYISELMFFGRLEVQGVSATTDTQQCGMELFLGTQRVPFMKIPQAIQYSKSLTGSIEEILPKWGQKKGGEDVVIKGKGFGTDQNKVKVFIGNNPCDVVSVTDLQMTCKTNKNTGSSRHKKEVTVLKDNQKIRNESVSFEEVELWSDVGTWNNESVPQKGEEVVIGEDRNILIDTDLVELGVIRNYGKLHTKTDQNLNIDVQRIINLGGNFSLASDTHNQTLNVKELFYNLKGQVHIKGKKRPTYEATGGNLTAGTQVVTLDKPVDWKVDEEVMLPTTNNNRSQTEVRKIKAYDPSTNTLTLNQSLTHPHGDDNFNSTLVLMDRNVKVTGHKQSTPHDNQKVQDYGVIIMQGSENEGMTADIQDAQLSQLGNQKEESIQFKMNKDIKSSKMEGNLMKDMQNRCVSVEGSNQLKIKKNTMFQNKGINVYLENSEDTQVEDNLVLEVLSSNLKGKQDKQPSGIYSKQSAANIKRNKVMNSYNGIKLSSKDNSRFDHLDDNLVANVDNNGLEIDNTDTKNQVAQQVIKRFKAFNSKQGIYIKNSRNMQLEDLKLGNNQFDLNCEEKHKSVKIKRATLTGLNTKKQKDFQKNNKTSIGLYVPQNDKFEVEGLVVKGFNKNNTALFKVKNKEMSQKKKQIDKDRKMKEILDDHKTNQQQKERLLETTMSNYTQEEAADKQRGVPKFRNITYKEPVKKFFQEDSNNGKDYNDEYKFEDKDGTLSQTNRTGYVGKERKDKKNKCQTMKGNMQVCNTTTITSSKTIKLFGTLQLKNKQYTLMVKDLKLNTTMQLMGMYIGGSGLLNETLKGNSTGRNLSEYQTYKSRKLMFEIEVSEGQMYELELNNGQQIEELQLVLAGAQWLPTDRRVLLRMKMNSTYEQYKMQVDGQKLDSMNVTQDYYPLDNKDVGFNYNQQAMLLDILVHGLSPTTNKMFRILKLKRIRNKQKEQVVWCDKEVPYRNYSDVSNWAGGVLPSGPDVVIPCEWRMLVDMPLPELNSLTIYGELVFQDGGDMPAQLVIVNQLIIKETGILTAGNPYQLFSNNSLTIIAQQQLVNLGVMHLFGGLTSNTMSIMPVLPQSSSNRHTKFDNYTTTLNQTGQLFNYSGPPTNSSTNLPAHNTTNSTLLPPFNNDTVLVMGHKQLDFTRLQQSAEALSTYLILNQDFTHDLYVSDQLFIAATQQNASQGELVVVDSINHITNTSLVMVNLTDSLQHFHFGANYSDVIDERAVVAKVGVSSNKINIQGTGKVVLKGESQLINVMFTDSGKVTIDDNTPVAKTLAGCSFTNYLEDVVVVVNSHNVNILDNQFIKAQGTAVQILGSHNKTKVVNNLVLGMEAKGSGVVVDKVPSNRRHSTHLRVEGNVLVGIAAVAIDGVQHNNRTLVTKRNLIGLADVALRFVSDQDRLLQQHVIYRSRLVIEHLFMNKPIVLFSNLLMAVNKDFFYLGQVGLSYRNIIVQLQDSVIMGHSRNQKDCSYSNGISTYQPNIQNYMSSKRNRIRLVGQHLWNGVLHIDRVMVTNFQDHLNCTNNHLLTVPEYQQDPMQVILTNNRFSNSPVDEHALHFLPSKLDTHLCGPLGCTGSPHTLFSTDISANYTQLISTHAHSLLSNKNCSKALKGDYHICYNQSIQLLQYENWKFNKLQRSSLMSMGSQKNISVANAKGLQVGKYVYNRQVWQSVVDNKQENIIGFEGNTPYNLRFGLVNNPAGQKDNWIVVKVMINRDSACKVYVNGSMVHPLLQSDQPNLLLSPHTCGTNFYNATDTSLSFVLTHNCTLRYKLHNALKVSMHVNQNLDEFKRTNGTAKFRESVSGFLGVSGSRVMITNLRAGSVYVDFFVTPEDTNDDTTTEDPSAQTAPPTPNDDTLLHQLKTKLEQGVNSGSLDVGSPIIGMQTQVVSLPNEVPKPPGSTTSTNESSEQKSFNYLLLVVMPLIVGCLLAVVAVVVIRHKRKQINRLPVKAKHDQLQESTVSVKDSPVRLDYNNDNISEISHAIPKNQDLELQTDAMRQMNDAQMQKERAKLSKKQEYDDEAELTDNSNKSNNNRQIMKDNDNISKATKMSRKSQITNKTRHVKKDI